MPIQFDGHVAKTREVEFTEDDWDELFSIARDNLLLHIIYFDFKDDTFSSPSTKKIAAFAAKHGVDVTHKKDRVAFFTAALNQSQPLGWV